MNSRTTAKFRKNYQDLPTEIRAAARQAYLSWIADPYQSSLDFKQVHPRRPIYSVRVGLHWRAIGLKDDNTVVWYWIGSHADYDKILAQL